MNFPHFPVAARWFRRCSFILSLALTGLLVSRASAHPLRATARPPYKAPYDMIESVNTNQRTVQIGHRNSQDHSVMTLRVTQATEIQVQGQESTFKALKKGMRVDVTRGTDESEASRLVAN